MISSRSPPHHPSYPSGFFFSSTFSNLRSLLFCVRMFFSLTFCHVMPEKNDAYQGPRSSFEKDFIFHFSYSSSESLQLSTDAKCNFMLFQDSSKLGTSASFSFSLTTWRKLNFSVLRGSKIPGEFFIPLVISEALKSVTGQWDLFDFIRSTVCALFFIHSRVL